MTVVAAVVVQDTVGGPHGAVGGAHHDPATGPLWYLQPLDLPPEDGGRTVQGPPDVVPRVAPEAVAGHHHQVQAVVAGTRPRPLPRPPVTDHPLHPVLQLQDGRLQVAVDAPHRLVSRLYCLQLLSVFIVDTLNHFLLTFHSFCKFSNFSLQFCRLCLD